MILIATVVALVAAIAAHHGVGLQHDDGMSAVAQMCLAVIAAAATALLSSGFARVGGKRLRAGLVRRPRGALSAPGVPVARARHGPAAVSVLCVDRR